MGHLLRKRLFWFSFTSAAIFSAVCALKLFPLAFPILHINLNTSKDGICAEARMLANQLKLGPSTYEQATSFGTDHLVKTFVELECGGKEAVVQMMKDGLYEPYAWVVRHFQEQEIYEISLIFTPDGRPYGFVETVSEDEPGARISTRDARALAERVAQEDWSIDLSLYEHIETSKEVKPGGRIDRTFTYERTDTHIGKGHYRLRLTVSGDRLSELTHFVHVPEGFINRYEEMRSSNDTLAGAAQVLVMFLYGLGCCALGFLFLLRKRWLLWRTPLIIALLLSILSSLGTLNTFPLMWFQYDTALSKMTFILGKLTGITTAFFSSFAATFVILMMAESLGRRAFGNQIQLWRVWTPRFSCSTAVLGRTVGGYIGAGFELLFQVLFFILTAKYFGWWTPSDALLDPNVLATYLPWLNPIADSLSAGIYEEAFFRAIPLACAALLGRRLGCQRGVVIFVLIFQAFLFGAVHANYPQQPSYVRIFELAIPYLLYGIAYLRFGLLPVMIGHSAFDLVWYSLPLFVSSAPGAMTNRLAIIIIAFAPVLYCLFNKMRLRQWCTLARDAYNKAWQPLPTQTKHQEQPSTKTMTIGPRRLLILTLTAIAGPILWLTTTSFKQEAPALTLARENAIARATKMLVDRYGITPEHWQPLARAYGSENQLFSQRFVWQEGNRNAYQSLLGSYLDTPEWVVRFVKFSGTLDERAEEYRVMVDSSGTISRIIHKLPEAHPGARLKEDDARAIARKVLQEMFELNHEELEEISAISTKHDNRIDWNFIFVDNKQYPLKEGQARITIHLAGDTLSDAARYIHVPEDWQRHEQERDNISSIIGYICSILPYLLFLAAAVVSLIQATSRVELVNLAYYSLIFALIFLLQLFNRWPVIEFGFNTNEPFSFQAIQVMGPALVAILVRASTFAAMLMLAHSWQACYRLKKIGSSFLLSLGLGGALAGILSFLQIVTTRRLPLWADYSAVGSISPLLGTVLSEISYFITLSIALLGLQVLVSYLAYGNRLHRRILVIIVAILLGFATAGAVQPIGNFVYFSFAGILTSIFSIVAYFLILRLDFTLTPAVAAGFALLRLAQQAAFNAYPLVQIGAAISAASIVAIAWYAFVSINRNEE